MSKKILPFFLAAALGFFPARADSEKEKNPTLTYEIGQTYTSLISDGKNPERDLTLELRVEKSVGNKTNLFVSLNNHRTSILIKDFKGDGFGPGDSLKFLHQTKEEYNLELSIDHPRADRYKVSVDIIHPNEKYHRFYDIGRWGPVGIIEGLFRYKTDSIVKYGDAVYKDSLKFAMGHEQDQQERGASNFPINQFYEVSDILDRTLKGVVGNDPQSKKVLVNSLNKANVLSNNVLAKKK